ncbi:MAG: phage tail fiber protein [Klebsiella huaxiensis]|uniref:phage tail fiber domain-containing protein n=1 Tax=Klebsiella huaxiensis TaxID=2153354 RepID=UPI0026F01044|nr:phage tail fiber protein [Klebsiella huaxiensis]WEJ90465.1 MAG: phage tail fiber protein [Klebsiella huaxiensis]
MSVPNQTPYNIYTANGLSTVFAYEFYLISASDIQVTINGNEVTSGYTVSGVGNISGGEVTFFTAPANGSTVIFERVTPTYRLTDYQDNGDLLADTVNKDFDRLWMAIQRAFIYLGVALTRPLFGGGPFNANGYRIENVADPINDQDVATKKFVVDNGKTNLSRTLRVPDSSIPELPSLDQLEGKILAFVNKRPIGVLPESGSAADVMIELADNDGYRNVGECSSISELRAITLDYHGQKVKVKCWDMSQTTALIDVFYVYDATDTTSTDDGYRTVVNSSGQRFKAILNSSIDLRLVGLRSSGDNLGTAFNRVYNSEISRVILSGFALKMPTIRLPELNDFGMTDLTSLYNAKLNASIKIPSFVPVVVDGNYFCEFTPINDTAIWITNQIAGITSGITPWRNMQGVKMFSNKSGKFRLIGPGASTSQSAALKVGNTAEGSTILDCRDLTVEDIHARAFRYGLDFDFHDTYILTFNGLELTGNYWNIAAQVAGKANAGEKIIISNSTIADAVSHGIYWNTPGIALTIDKCSMDYCGGSVFYLNNGARGNAFKVNGGHIEGWGGMLVLQVAQSIAWYGERNRVVIDRDCEIKAAGSAPGVWASRRKILHSGAVLDGLGTIVEINAPIYWPAAPSEPHIALMGYTDTTPQYMTAIYNCPSSPYPDCLVNYRQSSNKGLYRFSGTEGLSVNGLADSATGYTFSTNGNPTIVYGGVDADGLQNIIIIFDSEATWVELSNKGLYYALERGAEINTGISVMMESITSGTLTLNTRFRYFYGSARTADGYEDGALFDVSALLTATYQGLNTPLTTTQYVGVQSAMRYVRQDAVHPAQAETVQPGIVLRGATGQARIKLPVIWPSRGKGACAISS